MCTFAFVATCPLMDSLDQAPSLGATREQFLHVLSPIGSGFGLPRLLFFRLSQQSCR